MNRTLPPLKSSQIVSSPSKTDGFNRLEFAAPAQQSATTAAHSFFTPISYEPRYAYPLIVWLHGPCSNEDELRAVMPLISTRNFVAVAPRGTRNVEGVRGAYGWEDSSDSIAAASERVQDCVELAREKFNVHPDRVFIAGHATGGTMAHRLGIEFPERFAGAISLGGPVPRGSRLLKHVDRARKLPLLLSVSPTAEKYPTERVTEDLRFLHNAGMTLSLRLYPAGDELTTVMFDDLNCWAMEQFCPAGELAAK